MNPTDIPDSSLAREALEHATAISPVWLLNHCLRSYHFARALGARKGARFDEELLFVATILHDVGLTDAYDDDLRFEVTGANAARTFMNERNVPEARTAVVWDAIALHTSVGIAPFKGGEVALAHAGIFFDVRGPGEDALDTALVERIFAEYPRMGNTKIHAADLIVRQLQKKPQKAIPFTMTAAIAQARIPHFPKVDIHRFLELDPWSHLTQSAPRGDDSKGTPR